MRHVDVSSHREGTDAMQENLVANRNQGQVGNYLCLDYKNNRDLKEKKTDLKEFLRLFIEISFQPETEHLELRQLGAPFTMKKVSLSTAHILKNFKQLSYSGR